MRAAKPFHIGDILSITTGRLVSPRGIGGVYEILNHMTGDNLFTHQLGRAAEACKPALLADHPFLAGWGSRLDEELDKLTRPDQRAVTLLLLQFVQEVGCSDLNVLPLADGEWLRLDPLKELGAMVGDDRVITVALDDGEI